MLRGGALVCDWSAKRRVGGARRRRVRRRLLPSRRRRRRAAAALLWGGTRGRIAAAFDSGETRELTASAVSMERARRPHGFAQRVAVAVAGMAPIAAVETLAAASPALRPGVLLLRHPVLQHPAQVGIQHLPHTFCPCVVGVLHLHSALASR